MEISMGPGCPLYTIGGGEGCKLLIFLELEPFHTVLGSTNTLNLTMSNRDKVILDNIHSGKNYWLYLMRMSIIYDLKKISANSSHFWS